jgi:hypothetical protein
MAFSVVLVNTDSSIPRYYVLLFMDDLCLVSSCIRESSFLERFAILKLENGRHFHFSHFPVTFKFTGTRLERNLQIVTTANKLCYFATWR